MRFLSVIAVALVVIGFGKLMDAPAAVDMPSADKQVTLPVEEAVEPEEVTKCPDAVDSEHFTCEAAERGRRPARKVAGKIKKVVKVVKVVKVAKVVKVFRRQPARRLLGRVLRRR